MVDFEVTETQKVVKDLELKPIIQEPLLIESETETNDSEIEVALDIDTDEILEFAPINQVIEETKTITLLPMSSRKLKVTISNHLLEQLELMQVDFRLN